MAIEFHAPVASKRCVGDWPLRVILAGLMQRIDFVSAKSRQCVLEPLEKASFLSSVLSDERSFGVRIEISAIA